MLQPGESETAAVRAVLYYPLSVERNLATK